MTDNMLTPEQARARRDVIELWASGVVELISRVLRDNDRIEFIGYLLMHALANRVKVVGTKQAVRELQDYIGEATATGLDVGTGIVGHAANVIVNSPLAGPMS